MGTCIKTPLQSLEVPVLRPHNPKHLVQQHGIILSLCKLKRYFTGFSKTPCVCVFVGVIELDPPQPVPEPVLYQSGPLSGGARQRLLLEDRPRL